MKPIDPRMEKILRTQGKMIVVNIIISVIVGAYVASNYLGENIWGFLGGLIFSSILVRILNAVTLMWLQNKHYGNDIEEMVEDAEHAVNFINGKTYEEPEEITVDKVQLTIVDTPDQIFGRYMDHEFYEWLDVKGVDDKIVRFNFKSTMDVSRGISQEIPAGCILLPPGLLYQVDEPVNTST